MLRVARLSISGLPKRLQLVRVSLALASLAVPLLAGCGAGLQPISFDVPGAMLVGVTKGGQQPVANSSVQIYAMNEQEDGGTSTPLLKVPMRTDSNGNFRIDTLPCPSAATPVYAVSTGGNPGFAAGSNNPNLAEMALLGPCGKISGTSPLVINEITTVAATFALSRFMKSYTAIGSKPDDRQQLDEGIVTANELADFANGRTPGPALPQGDQAPVEKLRVLANVLATCVDSLGGAASDGSACGNLFSYTNTSISPVASNTVDATLQIAQNPARNVAAIFALSGREGPFQPALNTAPVDWTLPISAPSAAVSAPSPVTAPHAPVSAPPVTTPTPPVTAPHAPVSAPPVTTPTPPITAPHAPVSTPPVTTPTPPITAPHAPVSAPPVTTPTPPITAPPSKIPTSPVTTSPSKPAPSPAKEPPFAPVLSPAPGIYTSGEFLHISSGLSSAKIYYTTDGTSPSSSSIHYSGAIKLTASTIIRAIAIASGLSSPVIQGSYVIVPPRLVFVTSPGASTAGTLLSPSPTVAIEDIHGKVLTDVAGAITIQLGGSSGTGLAGTLTASAVAGQANFPNLSIPAAGPAYTLQATSPGMTAGASRHFGVAAPVSVGLAPSSVVLSSSGTVQFTPAVTGAIKDTAVIWTSAPAVGTLSPSGFYTAPASITSPQTVVITATSEADSTKTASASVSLVPAVGVALTPGTVALSPSGTQQFTPAVTGTANTAVTWTLSPAVGTISPSGLYTAPASLSSPQTVAVTATSAADPTKSAVASVSLPPAATAAAPTTATYYLSPTGLDSNNGTSAGSPWLSPNHALNCGDTIVALPSASYSAANFASGQWGPVNCPAANNVAWLKCQTFDACKIQVYAGTLDGMRVTASYWGVQGWEISNTSTDPNAGSCFTAVPFTPTSTIHHIIFANNVANVCALSGLGMGPYGIASVDYWAVLGNISYRAAILNPWCGSGISAYEPAASDSAPGTHIYVAGNFSYGSLDPTGCWDGNGIIFDTFDGNQTRMPSSYAQQAVIENNMTLSNGGVGVRIEYNTVGNGPGHSTIIARHNTMWGNSSAPNQFGNPDCGEMQIYKTQNTSALLNLAVTNQAGCYGFNGVPLNAYTINQVDSTASLDGNLGWSDTGTNLQVKASPNFTLGANNVFNVNPVLANPTTPGAPNCSANASVPDCMATVIANFTPTAKAATGYGYQKPSATNTYDALFPQWLCNVNLPAGLVTSGCRTAPANP